MKNSQSSEEQSLRKLDLIHMTTEVTPSKMDPVENELYDSVVLHDLVISSPCKTNLLISQKSP